MPAKPAGPAPTTNTGSVVSARATGCSAAGASSASHCWKRGDRAVLKALTTATRLTWWVESGSWKIGVRGAERLGVSSKPGWQPSTVIARRGHARGHRLKKRPAVAVFTRVRGGSEHVFPDNPCRRAVQGKPGQQGRLPTIQSFDHLLQTRFRRRIVERRQGIRPAVSVFMACQIFLPVCWNFLQITASAVG